MAGNSKYIPNKPSRQPIGHQHAQGHSQHATNGAGFVTQQRFSISPTPPADEIAKLEAIKPGLGERILAMAEKEQQNRHLMHKNTLDANIALNTAETKLKFRGQWFALGGVVVISSLSAFAFYLGHPTQAATIASVVIIGLVYAFQKMKAKPEEKEKEE